PIQSLYLNWATHKWTKFQYKEFKGNTVEFFLEKKLDMLLQFTPRSSAQIPAG
ncbi:hypothetical protein ACJX0J_025495, partial [Zea mays]